MSAQLYKLICSAILRKSHTDHYITHNPEPSSLDDELCCLCLNPVDKEATAVEDVIAFSMEDTECSFGIRILKILQYLFGESISDVSYILRSVCKECLQSAIACYRFIRYCKTNFDLLSKAVDKLDHSLDIPDEKLIYKTMYITIAPEESKEKTVVRRYFDKRQQYIPQDTALPKLQMILESIHPKTSLCSKTDIKIEDILYDPDKPNEYKCKICEELFTDNTCLQIHFMKKHHHKEDMKCLECNKYSVLQLESILDFEVIETIHNENNTVANIAEENNVQTREDEINFDYSPGVDLEDTPEASVEVTVTNTAAQLEEENRQQLYTCFDCNGVFNNLEIFTLHRRKFNNGRCRKAKKSKYQCDHCKTQFTFETSLLKHNCLEKKHLCDMCGKNFSSKRSVLSHLAQHTAEKRVYSCGLCDKTFTQSSYLHSHMRLHSNERPFKCDFCPLPFKSKSDLKVHVNAKHRPASLPCNVCGRLYTTQSLLTKHQRKYHPNQVILTTRAGNDYKRRNEEGLVLECDICNRKFTARYNLSKHRRKHYNVKSSLYVEKLNHDS
ncbi:hypothetical protein NE865_04500 [Phthorimaea operculella]|nr:hypothetical protein NE865_04500 [Phthorimaea operculella]